MDLRDDIEDKHLLVSDERIGLNEALLVRGPRLNSMVNPVRWWGYLQKVFTVAVGSLNSDKAEHGLSEFTTTYNKLKSRNRAG